MDFSNVDNSPINELALQLAIILVVMVVVGNGLRIILKLIKAPRWLFGPFITLGLLASMYYIFLTYIK